MPVNDFNVGRDITFDIFDPNTGGIIEFKTITGFERKQETSEVKVKGIDGIVRYGYLPDGWSFSLELARAGTEIDDYFTQLENLYYGGKNVLSGQITETVTEIDGNISQYVYERVVMHLSDAGAVKGDAEVKMKIEGKASRRRKIV